MERERSSKHFRKGLEARLGLYKFPSPSNGWHLCISKMSQAALFHIKGSINQGVQGIPSCCSPLVNEATRLQPVRRESAVCASIPAADV